MLSVFPQYGLPVKAGLDELSQTDWAQIEKFIKDKSWYFQDPVLTADRADPLLSQPIPYGRFMLGFDFHLTPQGPRLIEINTNAGGLATVFHLESDCGEADIVKRLFINALLQEFYLAGRVGKPVHVAIVDDDVTSQLLFPEMKAFAVLLEEVGISTCVVSPEELEWDGHNLSWCQKKIDFVYNRLVDFRLQNPSHQKIREAALQGSVVLSPHPAAYVRVADKRNLLRLKHPLVPEAHLFSERSVDAWAADKSNWVFKPADRAGAKGVYRGDKISITKLRGLPSDTLVQEFVPPSVSPEGTKFDIRIFTRDTDILGIAARHFTGQVMEMRSVGAGFRKVLPQNTCCFTMMVDKKALGLD